jgi:hypothetical protein
MIDQSDLGFRITDILKHPQYRWDFRISHPRRQPSPQYRLSLSVYLFNLYTIYNYNSMIYIYINFSIHSGHAVLCDLESGSEVSNPARGMNIGSLSFVMSRWVRSSSSSSMQVVLPSAWKRVCDTFRNGMGHCLGSSGAKNRNIWI